MENYEIRVAIKESRIHQYEIATFLGISECTFSRWFRAEMSEERKSKILDAIQQLKGEKA